MNQSSVHIVITVNKVPDPEICAGVYSYKLRGLQYSERC